MPRHERLAAPARDGRHTGHEGIAMIQAELFASWRPVKIRGIAGRTERTGILIGETENGRLIVHPSFTSTGAKSYAKRQITPITTHQEETTA